VRAAHDIMLFTMSKITGHAGTRLGYVSTSICQIPGEQAAQLRSSIGAFLTTAAMCGFLRWALVKDREVARKMVYFVDRSTIGVSKESQLRATKILSVVSDAYEVPPAGDGGGASVPRLFDFGRQRMEERWRTLRATVAASGAFSLPEETAGYCNFNKQTVTTCPGRIICNSPLPPIVQQIDSELSSDLFGMFIICSVRVDAMREGRRGGLRRVPRQPQDRGSRREAVRRGRAVRQDKHAGQGRSV
jgi:hypothetical protein